MQDTSNRPPDYVQGTRLGVCLQTITDPHQRWITSWHRITCDIDKNAFQILYYSNDACDGSISSVVTKSFQDIESETKTSFVTVHYACIAQEETSSTVSMSLLPLQHVDTEVDYAVSQDYLYYTDDDQCHETVSFEAVINGKCLQTSTSTSVLVVFPWYARYDHSTDCTGSLVNFTAKEGCQSEVSTSAYYLSTIISSIESAMTSTSIERVFARFQAKGFAIQAYALKVNMKEEGFVFDDDYNGSIDDDYVSPLQGVSYSKMHGLTTSRRHHLAMQDLTTTIDSQINVGVNVNVRDTIVFTFILVLIAWFVITMITITMKVSLHDRVTDDSCNVVVETV
jgi:hypothetical protein